MNQAELDRKAERRINMLVTENERLRALVAVGRAVRLEAEVSRLRALLDSRKDSK